MKYHISHNQHPEILFWVGCAGSFDDRAKRITQTFAIILEKAGVNFAILGNEEKCTGDPARRSGNEFLFQMLALQNIETLNRYSIKKIVTTCPHCFNTLKNEYPELGGNYEVIHHTQLLENLLSEGKLTVKESPEKVTYHDSCYLGRANEIYEVPRNILDHLKVELKEMKRCKANGLCCGAGGAQMFKEDEAGEKRINQERIEEAIDTGAKVISANCPFCITMLEDGLKSKGKEDEIMVYDLSELIFQKLN
jgi:heterodisulfide reductase subunit D